MQASRISGFFFFSFSGSFAGAGSAGFFLSGDLCLGGGLLSGLSSIFLMGFFSIYMSSNWRLLIIFASCICYFLSTIGTTLATSSTGKLSSDGSLSEPPEESPSPLARSFLLFVSSYSNIALRSGASPSLDPYRCLSSSGIYRFS